MVEKLDSTAKDYIALTEEMKAINAELERLNRMKDDLLANVSHELKTPLTSAQGYVGYILTGKMGKLSAKQKRALEIVHRNLQRLEKQISNLLQTSRDKEIEIHPHPFLLQHLMEEVLEDAKLKLQQKDLKLTNYISKDLPAVWADREKIRQVIQNLLDNAIKFTNRGGEIRLWATPQDDQVVVRLQDTGIGIPEDELPHIFEKFYQVESSRSRAFVGSGLGLSIVKQIIEAHGTTISVESQPGRGTTFTFLLPMFKPGKGLRKWQRVVKRK